MSKQKNRQHERYNRKPQFSKIPEGENFVPTFEVVLLERNGLGEPYKNTQDRTCGQRRFAGDTLRCQEVHKYRVAHIFHHDAHKLRGQYEWFRKRNPLPPELRWLDYEQRAEN